MIFMSAVVVASNVLLRNKHLAYVAATGAVAFLLAAHLLFERKSTRSSSSG